MIDITLLRKKPQEVGDLLKKKDPKFNIADILETDTVVRNLRLEVEDLRKQKNDLAGQAARGMSEELRQKSIEIGKVLKAKEIVLGEQESAFVDKLLRIPNIPQNDIPVGNKESNVAVSTFGQKPVFNFEPLNHVELNKKNKWFDFEAGARMTGAQFPCYRGDGVKVVYALTRLLLKNNVKNGFEPVLPPTLVNKQAMINSSNLPKFEGDFYELADSDLCLLPTSEVPLTNLYAGSIIDAEKLPIRMTAWTSCFRKEAGGYGAQERGLIRMHQFEKVELYSICSQEKSASELEFMVTCAQELLKKLGLHYQVSLLAGQDCSFASAKTYDIEVWLPGQNRFYEVSSCSNCTDFQARRADISYRPTKTDKPQFVHTLNASSLALSRLMVALMECYQQADGSIKLPQVLQDEMNNLW